MNAPSMIHLAPGDSVRRGHPDSLTSALRGALTQPRLAGAMAAEARRLAPTLTWSVVADSYQTVAQQVISDRAKRS